jgi:Protein of unknown function (DUF3769)
MPVSFRHYPYRSRLPHIRRTLAPIPLALAFGSGLCHVSRSDELPPAPVAETSQRTESPGGQEHALGPVRVEKFGHLRWSPETNALHSDGPVTITYTDSVTKVETVLAASDLNYEASSFRVRTHGVATFTRPDGRIQGSNIDFDLRENTGRVENGIAVSDYFRMSGDVIERLADGSYHLTNGDFTTCIHGAPDYHFHVKDLTFDPNRYVKAHNVRVFLGNFALPSIPYLRRGLGTAAGFPFPTPSYNKTDGFGLRLHDNPVDRPYQALDYDLNFNLRRLPTGFAVFQRDIGDTPYKASPPRILLPTFGNPLAGLLEQITPPTYREYADDHYNAIWEPRTTLFATIQNQQFVYNRRIDNLNVSRLPEAGVQFINILGRPFVPNTQGGPANNTIPDSRPPGIGAAVRYRTPNTLALLNVTAGLGQFIENPTKVSAGRLSVRANFATQPLLLGRRLSMRAAVSEFLNMYTTGSIYQMLSPEVELDLVPTQDSLFNVGYRYVTDAGRTPFEFDRRDIRHELRLQYQVGGPWAFGVTSKIDLERSRAYDGEIAIVRNFDCMQVGLVYRLRSQSFNILFNVLPPRRSTARPLIPLRNRP